MTFLEKIKNKISLRKPFKYVSQKNGIIVFKKTANQYEVCVDQYFQSGSYINKMWRKILRQVPKSHRAKQILLLGLGAGGAVVEIKKRFQDAHITCVEHDPVMADIAKSSYLKKIKDKPEILLADAGNVLKDIKIKFDIILIDLFKGPKTSFLLTTDNFCADLFKLLENDGYLLINYFRDKSVIEPVFKKKFSLWTELRYKYNKLGVFRHFGQGQPNDPCLYGFQDKEQSIEYLSSAHPGFEILGQTGSCVLRQKIGCFCFDHTASHMEPTAYIAPTKTLIKITTWQPMPQNATGRGWFVDFFSKGRQIGIFNLNGQNNYWENWSAHAARHRKKWLAAENYDVVEVDFLTFEKTYHASGRLNGWTRKMFLNSLKYHWRANRNNLHLFAAIHKESGEIGAGMAVLDLFDISQSVHLIAFVRPEIIHKSAGVGLIDHWFQHCLKNNLRFLNFGLVWKKGDPRGWQKYSNFKRQFNLHLVRYPRQLIKIKFGR